MKPQYKPPPEETTTTLPTTPKQSVKAGKGAENDYKADKRYGLASICGVIK